MTTEELLNWLKGLESCVRYGTKLNDSDLPMIEATRTALAAGAAEGDADLTPYLAVARRVLGDFDCYGPSEQWLEDDAREWLTKAFAAEISATLSRALSEKDAEIARAVAAETERCARIVDDMAAKVRALLDNGKGEHGKPGYVRDETWASWGGQDYALRDAARVIRARTPTSQEKK